MPTDLCNLGDLKAWLGYVDPKNDQVLQNLISNVSQQVYNRIGRQDTGFVVASDVSETRNGTGTPSITTRNFPINSVSSVTVDGVTFSASPNGVIPGYVFDQYSISLVGYGPGVVTTQGLPYPGLFLFTMGKNNVHLAYNAGYVDGVPYDLSQDVLEICALKEMGRRHIGLKSSTSKTGESSTFDGSDQIDRIMKKIEGRYRRFGIIS